MSILERLGSYVAWPAEQVSVSPIVLANAGFSYSGRGDRVTCPVCRIDLEGWSSGQLTNPRDEHRRRSPQCALAVECSKVCDDALAARVERLLTDQPSAHHSLSTETHCTSVGAPASPASRPARLINVLQSAVRRAKSHGVFNSFSAPDADAIDRKNPDFARLKFESSRLSTYHDWPTNARVKPSDLAADGWFYTGQNDRVCCVFCRGVLHHWSVGDVPSSEHRRHFPGCPYVRGMDVGNVPFGREQNAATAAASPEAAAAERGPDDNHVRNSVAGFEKDHGNCAVLRSECNEPPTVPRNEHGGNNQTQLQAAGNDDVLQPNG